MARRRTEFGLLLLAHQLFTSPHIPPITFATILGQAAIFLGFLPFLAYDKIYNLCVLPHRILFNGEWYRLIFASFMHADDMHLYYNMVSFLWKGKRLEKKFGSSYFALLLATFSILTNVILVGMSFILEDVYSHQCTIGFSGVIFALKVLTTHYDANEDAWIFGRIPVPSKYACWIELFVIQMFVPNASFLGHLAGIFTGLLFTKGPLKFLLDTVYSIAGGEVAHFRSVDGEYFPPPENERRNFTDFTGGLDYDEQIRRAAEESRRDFFNRERPRPSAPYEN